MPDVRRDLVEGSGELQLSQLVRILDHVGTFREVPARPRGVDAPPGPLTSVRLCVVYYAQRWLHIPIRMHFPGNR